MDSGDTCGPAGAHQCEACKIMQPMIYSQYANINYFNVVKY